ncbi:MAG: hypothetical protein AB1815_05255 [Bacillota bacterium]
MKKPAKTFEDLLAWQKAHLFVLALSSPSGLKPLTRLMKLFRLLIRNRIAGLKGGGGFFSFM